MKNRFKLSGIAALATVIIFTALACENPANSLKPTEVETGSITGKAVFTNSTDNSGITITLEESDGLRSVAVINVSRSIAEGVSSARALSMSAARSVTATAKTAADGSYTLKDVPAGTYTLYASSQDSLEKAVTKNVIVRANEVFDAGTLNLTPVGSISGQIIVDNGAGSALGFLVSVAGTSFMAVTGSDGRFTISGIPAGSGYFLVVTKGNYTALYTTTAQSVTGGGDNILLAINITSAELNTGSEVTIGANGNWYINGVDTGVKAQGDKGDAGTSVTINIDADGYWVIDGARTGVRAKGENGADGSHGSIITIINGNWYIDGEDTGIPVQGEKGEDGNPGSVVTIVGGYWYIDGVTTGIPVQGAAGTITNVVTIVNGNWYIDGVDTGVSAQGPKGTDGSPGSVVTIVGGYWYIDGVSTGVKAQGEKGDTGADGVDGSHGSVVTIVNGNWYIDGVDTGIPVRGEKGDTGADGRPGSVVTIGGNGNWKIDGVDTGIPARGADGTTPHIGVNGNWWIGDTDTGVKAQGPQGNDGNTPYIGPNGNWWIGDTDTGIPAQGDSGDNGKNAYLVLFHLNDGDTPINATGVNHGDTVGKPADPTRDFFDFEGWYTDKELTVPYNFTAPVIGNINLYAKWKKHVTEYVITSSGESFTASDGVSVIGTLQAVIEAIRIDANSNPCTIQFGNGTDVLDIGMESANFNNIGGTWGIITLMGKITSANDVATQGTIGTANLVSINSTADIANTAENGRAVYNNGGTFTILDGTVSGIAGYTVYNNGGTLTISGGMVSGNGGTVYNSGGPITISGGTVSGNGGTTVQNSFGTVAISGGTVSGTGDTVFNNGGPITISGGTVSGTGSYTVFNNGGTFTITNGTVTNDAVSVITGCAVYGTNGATLTISGGTISASASMGTAVYTSIANAAISGGTISVTGANGRAVVNNSAYSGINISGTANITSTNTSEYGGTISNTDLGNITITGGTVVNTASGNAVYNSSTGIITLGGDPTITGFIGQGVSSTGLTINSSFNPVHGREYTLNFVTYSNGSTAVKGGAGFVGNFKLKDTDWMLIVVGSDLVIEYYNITLVPAGTQYTITGAIINDVESFTAVRDIDNDSAPVVTNQPIQTVLNMIRNEAIGIDIGIQFGDGIDPLNIGSASVGFNGTWGLVTLSGKIASSENNSQGTVRVSDAVSIISTADIVNTGNNFGRAVTFNSSGTLTFTSGTVGLTTARAFGVYNESTGSVIITGTAVVTSAQTNISTIYNASNGSIIINGGTVENTSSGNAVYNTSNGSIIITAGTVSAISGAAVMSTNAGMVEISGGTVSAVTYSAVFNQHSTITVSNNAVVTSAIAGDFGTIYNGGQLIITGGTVENTTSNANARAVLNGGTVTISGGTVLATGEGRAISNEGGQINLYGDPVIMGTIFHQSGGILNVADGTPPFNPSPGRVYTLDFASYTVRVAVTGGGSKLSNFTVTNIEWKLMVSTYDINDLVLELAP